MNYIVLDLEWNQSGTPEGNNPLVPFEIIEIGAVMLNSDKVMISEFSALIKPQIYKTMHYMTGKLVHIKMQELKHEQPFEDVIARFLEWCGEDYVFCTWGPLDLTELQRNMNFYGIKPLSDGPIEFYDIQKLYAISTGNRADRVSLETAIDRLSVEKDIPFHRAFSDAYYTAKVMAALKDEDLFDFVSFDTYNPPKDKKHEIHRTFRDYDKYITRSFSNKEDLLSDKEVRDISCYFCEQQTRREVKLFTPNNRFYLGVSYCEDHGYVKTKIRIRKTDLGRYFAVKTKRFITADEAQALKERSLKQKDAQARMSKKP